MQVWEIGKAKVWWDRPAGSGPGKQCSLSPRAVCRPNSFCWGGGWVVGSVCSSKASDWLDGSLMEGNLFYSKSVNFNINLIQKAHSQIYRNTRNSLWPVICDPATLTHKHNHHSSVNTEELCGTCFLQDEVMLSTHISVPIPGPM